MNALSCSVPLAPSVISVGAPPEHTGQNWPLPKRNLKLPSVEINAIPTPGSFFHPFYILFAIADLKALWGAHMPHWIFSTQQIQLVFLIAFEREQWRLLHPQSIHWVFSAAVMRTPLGWYCVALGKKRYIFHFSSSFNPRSCPRVDEILGR